MKHPLRSAWSSMRTRCNNPNVHNYHRYGGRGIKVCKRWDSFQLFVMDMGPKPTKDHSLDRYPRKNGNYTPSNCRWATIEQQANNKDSTTILFFRGKKKPLAIWCRELGIKYRCARSRLHRGYPINQVLRKGWFPQKSGKSDPKSNKIELYNLTSKKRKVVYGLNEAALFLNIDCAGVGRAIRRGKTRRGYRIRIIPKL